MDENAKPVAAIGFGAGFRLGLGFMAAVTLSLAVGCCALVLVAWLAYGSVRDMAVATVGGFGSVAGSAAHAVVDDARQGVGRVRDKVVEGAASTVQRVGGAVGDARDAVRDGTVAAGERAAGARDALRERAGGIAGRIGWGRGKDAEPPPAGDPPPPAR